MLLDTITGISAMSLSLIAIILLAVTATRIGGVVGKIINLLSAGILLSVTAHAGFELLSQLGILPEDYLMPIMGTLIIIGSVFFITAGVLAIKKFK